MPKLYAENSNKINDLKPKNETIKFILNYSKALKIIKIDSFDFELINN